MESEQKGDTGLSYPLWKGRTTGDPRKIHCVKRKGYTIGKKRKKGKGPRYFYLPFSPPLSLYECILLITVLRQICNTVLVCFYNDTKLIPNRGGFEYNSEPGVTPSQKSIVEILY